MRYFFTILFFFFSITASAFAQEVYVEMPQNQGYVGVPMRLLVVYKDVQSDSVPTLPHIDGFTINRRPGSETSSQTTFVNGKVTSTSTSKYTFLLTPQRTGMLEIPAITFLADGKRFQTIPKTIEIVDTPTSGALKVEISGTSTDVYLGQPIDLTLRIFIEQYTDPILGVTLDERDMFSLVSSNSAFGMFAEAINDGRASVQTVRGNTEEGIPATFYVYTVQATTWPETTGTMKFEPVSILANYPLALERQQSFFGSSSLTVSQSKLISAQAEMPKITVLSTPTQGKPEWFTGAVGTFDFRMVAEPTALNVGEPITLTMRVTDLSSGPVNLDYLAAPALDHVPTLTDSFKVPDQPLGGTTDGRTKTFTQTIRPRNAGVTEIPPLPMSSFNPVSNSYITVWTKAIPILVDDVATVSANDVVGGASVSQSTQQEPHTEVDGGILANYVGTDLLESQETKFTPLLFAGIAFPPIACFSVAFVMFIQKRAKSESSIQKGRVKNAIRSIRSISTTTNSQDVQNIAKALRILRRTSCDSKEIDVLLKRCDAAQFGGCHDSNIAKDANNVVEQLT
jgi:hypothetical protein